MTKHILLIIFVFSIQLISFSQSGDIDENEIIEKRIEYLGGENEDIDYTTVFDNLLYYYNHPINLNAINQLENLNEIYLLTDIQINNLKQHIAKNNKLMSIYELQAVEGFDLTTIRNILPFVKVSANFDSPNVSFSDILKQSTNEIYLRNVRALQEKKGYSPISDSALAESPNSRYLGSPDKLFARYRFKYMNRISMGVTAEKDEGEEFFKGTQKQGFDFYSAHFFMKGFGKIKALAIGDYHMQLGQGLTVWTGQAFGKGADISGVKRNAVGIKPYASVDENNFMRGAAATIDLGKYEVTGFVSRKRIDANIGDTSETNNDLVFTSFQMTGFHRTVNERADKDAIQETRAGGRFAYVGDKLHVGVNALASQYGGLLERDLKTYNQFAFNSSENLVLGADYSYVFKNFNFFGEVARSKNGGLAHINGVLIALDPRVSFTVLYRDYGRDFQNLTSNALAENSRIGVNNEKALYFGVNANLSQEFIFSGYYDKFKFPWLRSQADMPNTEGYEAFAQLMYKPSRKMNMYIRLRQQNKPINANTFEGVERIRKVVDQYQTNYRFNVSYKVSDAFTLKNRVEYVTYNRGNNPTEDGFMINQDVVYKPLSKPYSFSLRYALFQTDSYNARIYAYENDVLYYFYIPAYYRTGSRFYLTARYKYKKKLDFWVRYGIWNYRNEDTILSGLEEIQGHIRSDIKLVVRYLF